MLGEEPDLQLVAANDVAHQQIVGPIVAIRRCPVGCVVAFTDDEFVSLQQAEQLQAPPLAVRSPLIPPGRCRLTPC